MQGAAWSKALVVVALVPFFSQSGGYGPAKTPSQEESEEVAGHENEGMHVADLVGTVKCHFVDGPGGGGRTDVEGKQHRAAYGKNHGY